MNSALVPDLPILLVDDEEATLRALATTLRINGLSNIITLADSREVMSCLAKQEVAFIILDLTMPHCPGSQLLPEIVLNYPHIPVLIATATDEVETVVSCIKNGAFDYLIKPIDPGRLLAATRCVLEVRALRRENEILRDQGQNHPLKHPEAFRHLITKTPAMLAIMQYCEAIATTTQPVTITGETGVGKELIAQALHTLSGRQGAFVAVNVAGLDDNIFADTLFGHIKGAYTGAIQNRGGQIKLAAAGTLFLDEIGDLSLVSQVKLLRLLQEREYMPLGADRPAYTDARIIVATNRNLDRLKESGEFRKDLYFRLYSHQIHIPPLRQRLADLPLLIDHFLQHAALELGKKKPTVPPELETLLAPYHFPGNIRELQALIFDAVSKHETGVMSLATFRQAVGCPPGAAANAFLPLEKQASLTFGPQLPTLKDARRLLVQEALTRANQNRTVAARLLGITRQSLSQYILSHNLLAPKPQQDFLQEQ